VHQRHARIPDRPLDGTEGRRCHAGQHHPAPSPDQPAGLGRADGRVRRIIRDQQPHAAAVPAAVGIELVYGHRGEVLAGHRETGARTRLAGQQADPVLAIVRRLVGRPAAPAQQPFHATLVNISGDTDPGRLGTRLFQANPEPAAPGLVERDNNLRCGMSDTTRPKMSTAAWLPPTGSCSVTADLTASTSQSAAKTQPAPCRAPNRLYTTPGCAATVSSATRTTEPTVSQPLGETPFRWVLVPQRST
jgi:hypothetical protein